MTLFVTSLQYFCTTLDLFLFLRPKVRSSTTLAFFFYSVFFDSCWPLPPILLIN